MDSPLFSVHIYDDDKLVRSHKELKPDQVLNLIPITEYSHSVDCDDILTRMAYLFPGESFSSCWSIKNKYVLVERRGLDDYIQIPVDQLRIKLPASPEDRSPRDKERVIDCTIFCIRGTKRMLNWLNSLFPNV